MLLRLGGFDKISPSGILEADGTLEKLVKASKSRGGVEPHVFEDFSATIQELRAERPKRTAKATEDPSLEPLALAARASRVLPLPALEKLTHASSREGDQAVEVEPVRRFEDDALDSLRAWHARRLCDDFAPKHAAAILPDDSSKRETPPFRDLVTLIKDRSEAQLKIARGPEQDVADKLFAVEVANEGGSQIPEGTAAIFLASKSGPVPLAGEAEARLEVLISGGKASRKLSLERTLLGDPTPVVFYRGQYDRAPDRPITEELVTVEFLRVASPVDPPGAGKRPPRSIDPPGQSGNTRKLTREPVHYRLVLTNKTERELKLVVSRDFLGNPPDVQRVTIAPHETNLEVRGTIQPKEIERFDTPELLNVSVHEKEPSGPPVTFPHKYGFIRVHPRKYIEVGTGLVADDRDDPKRPGHKYRIVQLVVTHKEDDPSRTPVPITALVTPSGVIQAMQDNQNRLIPYPKDLRKKEHIYEYRYRIIDDVTTLKWALKVDGIEKALDGEFPIK